MRHQNARLVFVYNANSGIISGLLDWAHKTLSPQTYECNLCALTYGNLGMRKSWEQFVKSLPYPVEFLHKDEFVVKYSESDIRLPTLVSVSDDNVDVLISADRMDSLSSLDELKHEVLQVMEQANL